ncbi:M20/M25/M40 family metallo-hydrolase [Streptomyces sp. NBC_01497]|uniref:M20/M25/M40 family metallo-hydrolase n=1 Tax=Streptomyces sp. NBC_01497 TaxID=2903885 RepID=UPI002E311115|nr:M20/M25/M40 family metallo-hydrolase [Streptomyces sp. NBC_01497]
MTTDISPSTEPAPALLGTDPDEAVDMLRSMLDIPSPSGEEHRIARHLTGVMTGLGLCARIDEAGNAIGETPARPGPHIMLLGHMDTVPGAVPVRREGDRLYGRGSVDAKGPLAAMIRAVAAHRDFPGRLTVVGVVEEETPCSRGAVHIGRTLPRPDALVVGEPSGWPGIVIGYKGKLDLAYRVHRPATHPSNPVEKASECAAALWQDVLELLGPDQGHGSFSTPGATLVGMRGDAEDAELDISVRTPTGFDQGAFVAALRERARGGELQVVNGVRAVRTDRRGPVVRALSAGIRSLGGTPRPAVKTATSDMNTLAEAWDIPMATYGPGDSALDHSDNEYALVNEYLRGIAVLTKALSELSDLPAGEGSAVGTEGPGDEEAPTAGGRREE